MNVPKFVVALSGGKDATAMGLRLKELYPAIPFEFVHTPTGDELPEMQAHFARLERLLEAPLIRLSNLTLKRAIKQAIKQERMLPNFRARWCTRVLKIEPFLEYMNTLPAGSCMFVGLRSDETGRLGLVTKDSKFRVIKPMQHWGWGLVDVLLYLECQGIEVPVRTDCARCFYQSLPEWYSLYLKHPAIYADAVQDEEDIEQAFAATRANLIRLAIIF